MKVAIGSRPQDGPWGGGNRFINALRSALVAEDHVVVHSLADTDIDVILIVDPRLRSPNVCFGAGAALRYVAFRNPNALVVHRINECDERKGEPFINHKLVRANYAADATVFVGEWLANLPVWRKHLRQPWFVIRNGADTRIFNAHGFQPWNGTGPIKLVTHHWGYHPMKGFDVYRGIDQLLGTAGCDRRLSFTYIGQLPASFSFQNVRYVQPLNNEALATELRAHHAYLTASINEPGGNHQVEGALCGLPLLYRRSGCMPEYCTGFGVPFIGLSDLLDAVTQLTEQYSALLNRMPSYPYTAENMTKQWLELFKSLLRDRSNLIARRKDRQSFSSALATQLIV